MGENPDDRQPNDLNHNHRGGYQGSIHLPPSLERRISSDAAEMARAVRALILSQEATEQAREQAKIIAAAPAAGNAVTFARIERSLARSEAITEEEATAEAEIEKWKSSIDAGRLRADLSAARRQSPEIEGRALETGGIRERIVSRMQAESGEWGMGVMPSAMLAEMLDPQIDSDKEEMEADALWPAKIKKEGKEDVPALEERKAEKQGRSEKHALGLDGTDERRPSPARTQLPPSRAASMSTQVGPESEATTSAATTSARRAGLSPVLTPGEVLRALNNRNEMSNGERYLKKVIQDREETTKRLLDHSKEVAGTDRGGLELLGVVFRTLNASALRKSRREEFWDLLREIALKDGAHGEDKREKARKMAESMIEDYQKETGALRERLVELSGASQLASLENVLVRPEDLLDHINRRDPEEEKEEMEKHRASMRESNLREMERRFGFHLAKQLNDRLRRDIAAAGQIPQELYHPARAVRNRFLLSTFPVDGEDIYFRPPCLSQPTSTRTMQDILDCVQQGEMGDSININHEETSDDPLPRYVFPSALSNSNRFLSSSVLPQQASHRGGAERFSLEREVLASIAAMADSSINEAQDNEDAQAEASPVAGHPAFSAAIVRERTMAQVLAEDYAKEMRERTIREREERILKRARQISAQHASVPAVFNRVEVSKVAYDENNAACSEGISFENRRRLELSEFERRRLDDERDDEKKAKSRSGALPANTPRSRYLEEWIKPQPWLTADRSRPGPPSGLHAAFLAEYQTASSAASTSQKKTIEEGKGVDSAANEVISSTIADVAKLDTISSSSDSSEALHGFPTMFLLSLDADMINLAGVFQQDSLVRGLTRSQFFELLEKTFPELWVRWKEYEADRIYVKDAGFKRGGSEIEKGTSLEEKEQRLRDRVEERGERSEYGIRKVMDKSVQDKGDGNGKGKEKPNLSIATIRTITDMDLQIERAKAFNEGNMAAFKDIETARKKGFEEGVKSVMAHQSRAEVSVAGLPSKAGQKSSYLHTIRGTFKSEMAGSKSEAAEGKAEDDSPDTRTLAKDGESMTAGGKMEEEGNSALAPYGFWGLVQFDSRAAFVGRLPRDFPWQSETCNAELFRLRWPNTLTSLKASLEDAVKKELEAMKTTEGSPKISQAGNVSLGFLEEHKISGFTLLWNWRREHILAGEGMMLSSRTPCLRTRITERNLQGVLWRMSEESGRHVLLVHTAKRDKVVDAGEKDGEETKSSGKKDDENKYGEKNGDEGMCRWSKLKDGKWVVPPVCVPDCVVTESESV